MALTTITGNMVSVNAIQGTLIADNAITAVHIATNAVSGTLIADNAITAVHIAQNSITVTQLADDCVESDKIADGVITTNHLNSAMISSQTEVTAVAGDFVLLGDTSDSNNLKKTPVSSIIGLASGTTINNNADNRIITGSGTADTLNGESGLTYDGSTLAVTGNITVTGTVDGRDIASDGSKLDGIESGATADQTAAQILTAIKTVDGSGSGLDADLLDGQQGSYYLAYGNLTGTPTIPSLSGYATETYVGTQISNLVDSSPAALNTLNELAAALGDDANFSTTVNANIAAKLPLAGGTLTGTLTANAGIALGNTGISGVNALSFNDPGPNEGLSWTGGNTKIYESPDDLTTNTAGNLQFVYGSTRRLTVNNLGIDVNGSSNAQTFKLVANTSVSGSDATIFRPADNTMAFSTNGVERMRIAADGYVSLTRGASEYGLELKSAGSRSGLVLKKPGTDSIMGSLLLLTDETLRLGTASSYNIQMYQNGNVTMPSGNVGIGTSSPNQDGFGSTSRVLTVKAPTSGGTGALELIGLANSSGDVMSAINFMSYAVTNPAARITAVRHTADDEASIAFDTSGAERMRIDKSGQTLINTTDSNMPTAGGNANCIIYGGAGNGFNYNALHVGGGRISLNGQPNSNSTRGYIRCDGAGFYLWHVDNSDMIFGVNDVEKMRIQWSDGRIKSQATYDNAAPATHRDVYVENSGQLGYASSVRAHKTNINTYGDASWLYQIDPKTFNYRKPNTTTFTSSEGYTEEVRDGTYSDTEYYDNVEVGLIAEDVEAHDPNLCFYNEVEDEDGNVTHELAGIHYKAMVVPMLKLLKEQKTLIDSLTTRIETLEG